MKAWYLFALAAFVLGCSGSSAYTRDALSHGAAPALTSRVVVLPARALLPRSPEAAAALKARGDAAIAQGAEIYRSSSAGVLALALEDNEPRELSVVYLPEGASDLALLGQTLFAAIGPSGVAVLDISRPRAAHEIARLDTPGAAVRLAIQDHLLAIADGSAGIELLDVTKPARARQVAAFPTPGYARDVALAGNLVFVAADRAGLLVLEHTPQDTLRLVAALDTDGEARALDLLGDRLAVALGSAGVLLLDVTRPSAPRLIARAALGDTAHDVVQAGVWIFVATGDQGVVVLKQRDGASLLTQVGHFATEMPVNRVALAPEQRLLVGNDAAGLLILDIKDPSAPRQLVPAKAPSQQ